MRKIVKKNAYLSILVAILYLLSCQPDQEFAELQVECQEPEIISNTTIELVKKMYVFGAPVKIDTDLILEGYINSDDEAGNIYKTIVIQDAVENPQNAIKISINETQLYTKYNVGRKIYVRLKGLAIGMHFGSLQIGKYNQGNLESIPSFELDQFIIRSCVVEKLVPKKVNFSSLNRENHGLLIEISDVQHRELDKGKSYANPENNQTVTRVLEFFNTECHLINTIGLRTSGFADFKNEKLPSGKGTVVGILDHYYEDSFLVIRNSSDVDMQIERCAYNAILKPSISLVDLRAMYQGQSVEFGLEEPLIMEGYTVSSDRHGNFENRLVIQDAKENPNAGIQILLDLDQISELYEQGDRLIVNLNKLYMDKVDGILTIGVPKKGKLTALTEEMVGNHVFNSSENYNIQPRTVTLESAVNLTYENTLIKVENIQLDEKDLGKAFANFSGFDHGLRNLSNCETYQKLNVFTNGKASFANAMFPKMNGSIIGVIAKNLELRSMGDIDFDKPYVICPEIVTDVLITEVADPVNSTGARFVELYNPGTEAINLNGWTLNKYINGATTVSSNGLDLTGLTIVPKGFLIIANESFKTVFNRKPDLESTYISSNGDDVYELVDSTSKRIDIFGEIGTDGNGSNWEFLDGKAQRKPLVNQPNKIFDTSEWMIYSKASNNKINFPSMPQYVPENFTPWLR